MIGSSISLASTDTCHLRLSSTNILCAIKNTLMRRIAVHRIDMRGVLAEGDSTCVALTELVAISMEFASVM